MPKFAYKAYAADDPKRQLADQLDASTRAEAASMLRRNGFIPVEVHEVVEKKFDATNIQIGPKRVKMAEMAFFTRQVSTMIRAGMSPLQALSVAQKGTSNVYLKDTLGHVKDSINSGASLSASMALHPKVFNNLYISLIKAGELGGVMPEALDRLADQMEKDSQMRKDIRGAMMYPMVVLIFAMCILTAMLLFVVPAFTAIFEGSGGKLPLLTQILVTASDLIRKFWFAVPFVPMGLVYGVKTILKTEDGRRTWDAFKLKCPMKIGPLIQKIVTARFARTLSTLQNAGVPILASLEICGPTTSNAVVESALLDVAEDIKTGKEISKSIREADIFPEMAVSMIEAGEEAGEVNAMLEKVAETYEADVAAAIKNLKSIMEPIMMIFIGGIVGVTVIALYMPIFKVYDQIK